MSVATTITKGDSYTGKKPWLARLLAHAGEALGQFRGI